MTTTNTRFCDPNAVAGGDGTTNGLSGATAAYVSLSVWEAARQADLVSGDIIEKVICSSDDAGSTHLADATACGIDGWTTDSTRYIQIEAASSHGGKWNDAIYRRVMGGDHGLDVGEQFVRIIGIQFQRNGYYNGGQSALAFGGLNDNMPFGLYVDKCIFKGSLSGSAYEYAILAGCYNNNVSGPFRVTNCIFYDFKDGTTGHVAVYAALENSATDILNCTFQNCRQAIARERGTVAVKNCGFASVDTTTSGTVTLTTCSTSTPTFVDADNDDFHLAAGDTTWRGQGTDLSGTFTDDIDGDTRSAPWDIGCDEVPGLLSAMTTLKVG